MREDAGTPDEGPSTPAETPKAEPAETPKAGEGKGSE
jgi:hypothetical protein